MAAATLRFLILTTARAPFMEVHYQARLTKTSYICPRCFSLFLAHFGPKPDRTRRRLFKTAHFLNSEYLFTCRFCPPPPRPRDPCSPSHLTSFYVGRTTNISAKYFTEISCPQPLFSRPIAELISDSTPPPLPFFANTPLHANLPHAPRLTGASSLPKRCAAVPRVFPPSLHRA